MDKTTRVIVDGVLGFDLWGFAETLVVAREEVEREEGLIATYRESLVAAIPQMREVLPPGEKSCVVVADGRGYLLTIQMAGRRTTLDKGKLVELGVSLDVIEKATVVSSEGKETVSVRRFELSEGEEVRVAGRAG